MNRRQLEKEAKWIGENYDGADMDSVFAAFDPNTGKRIRPDKEFEQETESCR